MSPLPVFMELTGGFSLGALCLSARRVFTCPLGDRGLGQLPGVHLQAAGLPRLLWKRRQSRSAVLCLPSGNPGALGMQRREAGLTRLVSPVWQQLQFLSLGAAGGRSPVPFQWAFPWNSFPGRSSAAAGQLQIIPGVLECSVPRQSEGENTKNHWIPKHSSSRSALSTCQIVNPLVQRTQTQFAALSSFGITYKLFTSNCAQIRWLYSPC